MNTIEVDEHFDPTTEITLEVVKKRAVRGVAVLAGRNVLLQIIGFVAGFFLTIFLSPEQFGVFVIVQAIKNFSAYFSDIGLAAALIQKKVFPTRKHLETTFTIQNSLVLLMILIIFLTTPFLRQWKHLNQEAVYLLWALAFSLLLSSLQSIPSALLERELDFNKQVIPQVIGTVIFQVLAVFLAWKGFGITSYTIAVLASGFVGLIIMYILKPWRPGFAFALDPLKDLLRFGLPYQINTFLAVFKDDGMTMVLGGILGPGAIGLLGWAQKYASYALRFFMDPVTKVTFPAFSRMQEHKEELSKAVSKSIFFICLLVFPVVITLVFLAPILIDIIPKYGKWQPALLALGLISINTVWAAITTPLTNALNAIGKIKVTFKLMIMWTILTWIFIPGLSYLYGVNGAAMGYALVGTSSIVAILVATRSIPINFWQSVGKPAVSSILVGIVLFFGRQFLPTSWSTIIILIVSTAVIYVTSLGILVGPTLLADAKKMALNVRGVN